MILKCIIFVNIIITGSARTDSSENYVDSVIDMLLNGESVEFSQDEENFEGDQPVLAEGIWKCGNCRNISDSKLVYSEVNDVDADTMDDNSLEVQLGFTLEDMRCITISSAVSGVVRRVSGSCNGTTVTLNVAMVPHFIGFECQNNKMVVKTTSTEGPKYMPVAEFYSGKSVFVTGGTGFLGKVLIEKLLHSCPKIEKVYVLIRDKKGIKSDQRIRDITDNLLFTRLREEKPENLKKLVLIPGDISQPNLGVSPENESLLIEKVSVVFHAAATVKFTEPLEDALKINVEGTAKILKLCKIMKKIKMLVHISTAYSNCNREIIEEVVYPSPANISEVYNYVKENEGSHGNAELLNGLPNTYTFTKALAENLIKETHENIPAAIIRPSIVTAILKEPIVGWLDNWYGATSLCTAISKGINRVVCGQAENVIDLVPVDYVANCTIAAGARSKRSSEVSVYNCCSSSSNPITLGDLVWTFVKEAIIHGSYVVPFPELYLITKYRIVATIAATLFQIIPAYIADFLRTLGGKSPRYVSLQSRLTLLREVQEFFSNHSWTIKNDQVRSLQSSLSATDQDLFPVDPTNIDWKAYLPNYCIGVRKYLEKTE